MPRGLTTAMSTEVAKKVKAPIIFFEGEFTSGTIYVWSGRGSRTWNGHTWTGVGDLASISQIEESGGLEANGIVVALNGLKGSLVAKALTEVQHSKKGTVYFGFLDAAGAIVVDPVIWFSGRLDTCVLRRDRNGATIAITYESRAMDSQTRERRFTHEDQQIDFPGDLGFQFVNGIQDQGGGSTGVPSSGSNTAGRGPGGNPPIGANLD